MLGADDGACAAITSSQRRVPSVTSTGRDMSLACAPNPMATIGRSIAANRSASHPRSVCGPSWLAQANTTASYFSFTASGLTSQVTTSTFGDSSWCNANTKAKLPVLPPQSLNRCSEFWQNASGTEYDGAINAIRWVFCLGSTGVMLSMLTSIQATSC